MKTKVSRREFARTSVAAGAAAVGLSHGVSATEAALERAGFGHVKAAAVAAARRRRVTMPPEVAYGGLSFDGRELTLEDTLTPAGQSAPTYPAGWREGTTIPMEYYTEEKHYLNDERFIAEHFWLVADHESRIPKPGDYFVFEFGRGDSVIILRAQDGTVKGFHNVCRHRGSRLCLHGFDKVIPSEAKPDGKPVDPRLSVVQLGPSGNTPVFRCPYHAWTYDLDGKLVSFPPGMPSGFNAAEHGLHPAHVRTVEGFIFVSFARNGPPDFDSFVANWRTVCQTYDTKNLKVVARRQAPTKANWKLVLENFRECYHCQPAHRSLVTAQYWQRTVWGPQERERIEVELARHGHPVQRTSAAQRAPSRNDLLVEPARAAAGMGGMGAGIGQHLSPGFVTGSLDGKPVAPLILKEWTHRRGGATTGFSTSFFAAYDDHIAVARFTPRDVDSTDAELFWLVRADAKDKDVDIDRLIELWHVTYREDRWIVENNQHGIKNSRFNFTGGQPYASTEGGPTGFVKWYMTEVAPLADKSEATA